MRMKIFQDRNADRLEEAVNAFLASHEGSVLHTQFTTCLLENSIEYWQEHTLIVFYFPRADEDADPFQEEEEYDDTPQPNNNLSGNPYR